MGWDRLEWGVAGTCRRKCSPLRCWTPQAAPLSLACLVVTVFSLTRDGMRLGLGLDWDWERLCYRRTGGQEDSPVSLFPLLLSLDLFGRFDRACRESTPVSRRRWDETPEPHYLGCV